MISCSDHFVVGVNVSYGNGGQTNIDDPTHNCCTFPQRNINNINDVVQWKTKEGKKSATQELGYCCYERLLHFLIALENFINNFM